MDVENNAATEPVSPTLAAPPPTEASADERLERLYPEDQPKAVADVPKPAEGSTTVEGIPDRYELTLTVKGDDGKDQPVQIDPVLLSEATPVLKDLGLTNDQANKVAGLVPKVQHRLMQQQSDEFATLRSDWAKQARTDPEIGGAKWQQSVRYAGMAFDAAGVGKNDPFRDVLDDSGLGNHPLFIKVFARLGRKLAGQQGGKASGVPDRLATLYPDD